MKLEDLDRIKVEIKILQKALCTQMEIYTEQHAPHQPGDNVTIEGYAYTGKKMIVERVRLMENYIGWHWNIYGTVIKADGTPGQQKTSFIQKVEE